MPVRPTTARGAATSRRILEAATEEFAEFGIAGARIERVTKAANTNKAQLYGYFGNKDGLFGAVISDAVQHFTDAVPFDAEDLPGWATGLYDVYVQRPELVRLITWIRLERNPAGLLLGHGDHEPKVAAIAAAQAAGKLRPADPLDLLGLVIGMSTAWSPASTIYTATAAEPAADHDRRREFLRESVARAIAP